MTNISNLLDKRRAGILLHITSLPSTLGNGTMGKHAYRFIDFLSENGLSVWQVLPIHPPQRVPLNTPHRDFLSPYQPQSVYAGNPLLINLDKLMKKGWLPKKQLPSFNNHDQLEQSFDYRYQCLKSAYSHFSEHTEKADREAYQQFVEQNKEWLDDYALFCVLKDVYQGVCWWQWQIPTRLSWS
jgi:4-alpha-glucanotransferase